MRPTETPSIFQRPPHMQALLPHPPSPLTKVGRGPDAPEPSARRGGGAARRGGVRAVGLGLDAPTTWIEAVRSACGKGGSPLSRLTCASRGRGGTTPVHHMLSNSRPIPMGIPGSYSVPQCLALCLGLMGVNGCPHQTITSNHCRRRPPLMAMERVLTHFQTDLIPSASSRSH